VHDQEEEELQHSRFTTCIIILIVEAAEVGCLQQIQAVPFRRDAKGH